MKKKIVFMLMVLVYLFVSNTSYGDQRVVAEKITQAPVIDGKPDESLWEEVQAIVSHDDIADIDITLKAAYTDEEIFFLVTFPDPDESRMHKEWIWDKDADMYKTGPSREDTFVFKWNMEPAPVDLSVYSDDPYITDVWFWKACRTDPVGFADDKIQALALIKNPKARELTSKSGSTMYLQRLGDEGRAAYKDVLFIEYKGDIVPNFENQTPTGSRADIRAKGSWSSGRWAIEFRRLLNTGNADDIQFVPGKSYQFGITRYEIAGRSPDPTTTQPLYGCGDVTEVLTLEFGE
ncbi:MAG: hypothetical protein KJ957_00105 [Candidatus Omnitrophica bacterium]|nr:hypothetical protein [Candidatus Omnitrophota bacterium]